MDGQKDDLKWFGEGFDGFPKRLPDDSVEYTLFIINTSLAQKEVLARLELVRKEATKLTGALLKDYIWQRDDFNLKLEQSSGLMHLRGLTNYGDSVEDEWLIVYILRELTKLFSDLWVKVVDTDGEFLLIEAANALPRWLNPEIADNRVWINNQKLRIIPLTAATTASANAKTSPVSRPLTLQEALDVIKDSPNVIINSPPVETEAFFRLRNYPAQISNSMHSALTRIPRKLAFIIHNCPAAVAPAVEAFYLRDPIGLKPLDGPSSGLVFPPDDLVTVSVKFTKVLYAQLKSQQFEVPRAWKPIFSENETKAKSDPAKSADLPRLELGMKITSGFEMLVTDSIKRDHRSVREMQILIEDLSQGEYLPTDAEIKGWANSMKEDDESWLDINFEDFEKELQGNKGVRSGTVPEGSAGPSAPSGFGDAKTQEDLKKMVQRFESFLNDDNAGVDGAEMDEMDFDDDDDEDDSDEDENEDGDKDVSFDPNEFARLVREMMGVPAADLGDSTNAAKGKLQRQSNTKDDFDSDDEEEEDEAEEIRKVMKRIGAELREAGALELDHKPRETAALQGEASGGSKGKDLLGKQDWEDESDEEVDIDFNLAKNLLESFKSQAGMAGPGGNIMGMMGMKLPRDEDDSLAGQSR
ncbi:hypothetical protein VC83_09224 [Pseudogymnoascus destructans]|uniref:Regulatory factor Sgt1 n=2 Tax=Pseudogymnoascus destructans TaxID=655981 RepID=L8FXY9_PSED2|nr:uncharacterized protein VC83_09224 [Pseudogymnoascus destructans]ELR05870.1 hypothetical protein GMDG_07643 [Pseudogymnoascus destructans 20631-21]OAF54440.2 hypothetical protein VC83_09224 [Pseudogymnoascus destructans]